MTTTKHRERSVILGDDALIRALLDGAVVQHWFPVDPPPPAKGDNGGALLRVVPSLIANRGDLFDAQYDLDNPHAHRCPLGAPGDRLWLREAWADADIFYQDHENDCPGTVAYRADLSAILYKGAKPRKVPDYDRESWNWDALKWRSPATMPRWASRLTVEIVTVRMQRVQDITEDDAIASGARPFFETFPNFGRDQCLTTGELAAEREHRAGFAVRWDERHVKRHPWKANPWAWQANPWAWALTLRRVS